MNSVILQSPDHFESSAIADMRKAWIFVASKIPLQNAAIFCAIEDRAPFLEFADTNLALPSRAVRPCAIDSHIGRRASCRRNAPSVVAIVHVAERRRDTALAMTVCALPNNDLQTIPTLNPRREASIAARSPAPTGANDKNVVGKSFVHGHWLKRCPAGRGIAMRLSSATRKVQCLAFIAFPSFTRDLRSISCARSLIIARNTALERDRFFCQSAATTSGGKFGSGRRRRPFVVFARGVLPAKGRRRNQAKRKSERDPAN